MVFPNPNDDAQMALAHVAAMAASQSQLPIVLAPQRDAAFGWTAAAVHPMQALETQYQSIVRDAERLGQDMLEERARESAALDGFYFFSSAVPQLLGVERGRPFGDHRWPLPIDALRHALAELRSAEGMLAAHEPPELVATRVLDARAAAWRVCQLFMPPGVPFQLLATPIARAANLIQPPVLQPAPAALRHIGQALGILERAVAGDASVQMFYTIEPFYLYRLLVRYAVRSATPVREEDVTAASSALTDILNAQQWLADWLEHAMIDLEQAIAEVDVNGNTRFFVKGGRALAYLFGYPQTGRNDWDTQILIDPNLPPGAWYDLYRAVSNQMLVTLSRLKAEFYGLLWSNAGAVRALPLPPPAGQDRPAEPEPPWADIDEAADPPPPYATAFVRACKAELIDIGMPRRDTIELREQWAQLRDNIIRPTNGVPVPGYPNYVDEYIAMIREYFAGAARSAKVQKRIDRLAELLETPGAAIVVVQAMQTLPLTIWTVVAPVLTAFVAQQIPAAREPVRYVEIVLLDQFAVAYEMERDPGLAGVFAADYANNLPNAAALANYPPNVRATLSAAVQPMADAIGFGGWMSGRLQQNLAGRAALVAAHRDAIDALIRTLYDASLFDQRSDYAVQFAVGGSLGARLHADYQGAATAALDPVATVSVGLYFEGPHVDADTVIELVAQLVRDYVANQPVPLFYLDETMPGTLRLFWAEEQAIAPFAPYHPLAVEIVAKRVRQRPLLSYIWGVPILGLRDLIVEYQTRAAHVVEYARRSELRRSAASLTEMLMTTRD